MSELAGSQPHWEDYGNRVTDRDQGLAIRIDPVTHDALTIAFDRDGVVEIPGSDAYFHPNVTPELQDSEVLEPWDEALDEFNTLSKAARQNVLARVERLRKGGSAAPILLVEAVRKASERRGLDRAA